MKKLSLLLAILMAFAVIVPLTGCNNTTERVIIDVTVAREGYPIVSEAITLNMFGSRAPVHGDWEQMLFFTEMEARTGISFNFTTPSQDTVRERRNMAFATNDLPDLFFGVEFEPSEIMLYASQGQIIPLNDLIQNYAPNLRAIFAQYPELRKDLTAPDGNIYGLATMRPGDANYYTLLINQYWLNQAGLTIPRTTEEFYQALVAFRELDPNSIPFSLGGPWEAHWLAGAFGVLPHDNGIFNEDGTIVFAFTDERYREYLRFMNRLFEEGLLDPESFTQSGAQLNAKGHDGLLGAFFAGAPFFIVGDDLNYRYEWVPALAGPRGDRMWIKGPEVASRLSFAITSANPYPEATMRWIDSLFSPDAGVFINNGMEGVSFRRGADGIYEKIIPAGYSNFEEFRGRRITPAAGMAMPAAFFPRNENTPVFDDDEMWIEIWTNMRNAYAEYGRERHPILYFTEAQNREIATIAVDLRTFTDNMIARFIMGDASLDDDWDEFVATTERMRVADFVRIYQEAMDAREGRR